MKFLIMDKEKNGLLIYYTIEDGKRVKLKDIEPERAFKQDFVPAELLEGLENYSLITILEEEDKEKMRAMSMKRYGGVVH